MLLLLIMVLLLVLVLKFVLVLVLVFVICVNIRKYINFNNKDWYYFCHNRYHHPHFLPKECFRKLLQRSYSITYSITSLFSLCPLLNRTYNVIHISPLLSLLISHPFFSLSHLDLLAPLHHGAIWEGEERLASLRYIAIWEGERYLWVEHTIRLSGMVLLAVGVAWELANIGTTTGKRLSSWRCSSSYPLLSFSYLRFQSLGSVSILFFFKCDV